MATKKPAARTARKADPKRAAPAARADPGREDPADWRGATLARVRKLIHEADPDAVEERKWRKPTNPAGVATWSHGGLICTGEAHQSHVRMTFMKGRELKDPKGLFAPSPPGNARRAIVLREGDELDAKAFQALFRQAVSLNDPA